MPPYLIVLSDPDPVAHAVAERWGTPPATGWQVEGAPIRQLGPGVLTLARTGLHIHDERLDARLPADLTAQAPTLVFPSIHRSEQNVPCLTVHPLGNPGAAADVGGRPRTLVRADPARMAAALRRLSEAGSRLGMPATYEATHHGPELGLPAFFVEIGYGAEPHPPAAAVRELAETVRSLEPDRDDTVALAVGGGHYAPHFTDLALKRRWAFGHLLSRHALTEIDRATAVAAYRMTPGGRGVLYARAADAELPVLRELGPRLRESAAGPRRASSGPAAPPTSGT